MAAPRSSCRVAEVGRLFGFGNFLRHQLRTALQRAPPRLRLRGSDQTLLVWMTRHWPTRHDPTSNESPGPEQRDPRAQINLRAILTPRPSTPASLAGVPSRETESSGPRGVRGSAAPRAKGVGAAPKQPPQAQAPKPAQIDRNGVLILIRSALLALDQANKTGNYTVFAIWARRTFSPPPRPA